MVLTGKPITFYPQFTTDPGVTYAFHSNLQDAQNGTTPINSTISLSGTQTIYIRFEKNGVCAIGKIIITIKTPKNLTFY
jgi:hypothetical protein